MFDSLRVRILIALSMTCAGSQLACARSNEASAVDNEGPRGPKPAPDPEKKKKEKREWVPKKKSSGGSCPTEEFCSTAPEVAARGDASALEAQCGATAKIPAAVAWKGFAGSTASFSARATSRARETEDPAACCYVYTIGPCGKGRPLRHEGELVLATDVSRAGWCDDVVVDLRAFSPAERATFVTYLRRVALLEHGSVAAFAQVSLELLALGAPSDLVEAAHRAALDEIRHARLCWSVLAAVEGAPRGPSPMTIPPMPAVDVERILVATVVEGCVGETLGSLLFAEAARRCTVPALATMYATIANEEAEHAALAFRIVQFHAGGEDGRYERALEAAARADRSVTDTRGVPPLGVLDGATQRDVLDRGYREVIVPLLSALAPPREENPISSISPFGS